MTQRVDFIDVSHWQGKIDFTAIPESVVGVIAKATEGTSYVDDMYAVNRAGALQAGFGFASYHYLHHGKVAEQMAHYLSVAKPEPGERVVIDYEEADPRVSIEDLKAAVDYLKSHRPDLEITVYGASMLTDDCVACTDLRFLDGTSLWAARYSEVNQPTVADPPWPYWSAWQFSDEGEVKGVDGDCDVNQFNGSKAACQAWFGLAPDEPIEPDEPRDVLVASLKLAGHEVIVHIDRDVDVVVSVWVDGAVWEESVR